MKRPFQKAILTLLSLQIVSLVFASGTLYVYYDPSCMARMEYSSAGDPSAQKFVVYQIQTASLDKVSLVIGPESTNPVAIMPAQTLHCGNSVFDQAFVKTINQKQNEVLLVRPNGDGRFFISRVAYASYLSIKNDLILYQSPRFQFAVETNLAIIGENISINKQDFKVFFDGRIENGCKGEYLFSMSALSAEAPEHSIVIVPEIGIVEERNGPQNAEGTGILRLEYVNNVPTTDYLRIMCNRTTATAFTPPANQLFTARSAEPTAPSSTPPSYNYVEPPIKAAPPTNPAGKVSDPCKETPPAGYHIVQKGENLYRIASRYQISIGQIQEWNQLGNKSTIYPCQKIKVAASPATSKESQFRPALPISPNAAPIPEAYGYNDRFTPRGASPELPAWKTQTGFHTVQPGETIAAIAMKYGYTEYRFRYFNNLASDEVAKTGQLLKTSDCEISSSGNYVPKPYNVTAPVNAAATANPLYTENIQRQAATTPAYAPSSTVVQSSNTAVIRPVGNSPVNSPAAPANTPVYTAPAPTYTDFTPKGADGPVPTSYEARGTQLSSGLATRMAANSGSTAKSGNNANTRRTTHLVSNGQTLSDIARLYNTTTENLRRLNQINPGETIIPGQRIYVN